MSRAGKAKRSEARDAVPEGQVNWRRATSGVRRGAYTARATTNYLPIMLHKLFEMI